MNATSLSRFDRPALETEAQFLDRLRAGDEDAYENLVRQYSGRMLAVARRFFGCTDESADAVQEAYVAAFQAVHSFQGTSSLATWLHRIVVNVCLMKIRSRTRRRTVPIDDCLPTFTETGLHSQPATAWSDSAFDRISRVETQSQVRACIDRLPNDFRTILLLRDIEEIDTEKTAGMLGISIPAVKTRLHRARQALRTLLDPILRPEYETELV